MSEVTDNAAEQRFEIHVDGVLAGWLDYHTDPDGVVALPHTEVLDAYAGQGLASLLVRGALDSLRAEGRHIRPVCPYVKGWLRRNPDAADLVAADPDA